MAVTSRLAITLAALDKDTQSRFATVLHPVEKNRVQIVCIPERNVLSSQLA
jgi:hypothetical protein